jgi:hypothetical protein
MGILLAMNALREPTTETEIIGDALRLIDKSLADLLHRELVSTDEVSDLLLDVRTVLSSSVDTPVDEGAPVGA